MAKTTELAVTVYNVKRGQASSLGNPRFIFNTDHGRIKTAPNTSQAYAVTNDFPIGETLDKPATLILDGYGNIIDWRLS